MSEGKQIDALKRKEDLEKLEKQKEAEIKKLKEEIKEAEQEVRKVEEEEEKVPIPQVATRDTTNVSAEAKLIIETQRGIKTSTSDTTENYTEESIESKVKKKQAESLDEQLANESIPIHPGQIGALPAAYRADQIGQLSLIPIQTLYTEMQGIYAAATQKGYVSPEEQTQMYNLGSAIEQKVQDVEAGNYSFNKTAEIMASVSLSLKEKTSSMYIQAKEEKSMQEHYKV